MRPQQALVVRRALIISFAILSLMVLFSYYRRYMKRDETIRRPEILGSEIAGATESIEYTEHREGRDLFRVRAHRYIETRGGKNILEGVEAYNFGKDGRRRDAIRSDFCEYDQNANLVFFSGRVVVKTTEGTEIFTDALSYSKATETATAAGSFKLKRAGLEGGGVGLSYNFSTQDFAVQREANFRLDPDIRILSQSADFARSRELLSFRGGVKIVRTASSLSSDEAEAFISVSRRLLRMLDARGSADYKAQAEGGSLGIKAQEMRLFFDDSGSRVSELKASNQALLKIERQAQRSVLTARQIALAFDLESGTLDLMQGLGGVRFSFLQPEQEVAISGEKLSAEIHQGLVKRVLAEGEAKLLADGPSKSAGHLSAEVIDLTFASDATKAAIRELKAQGRVAWVLPCAQPQIPEDPPRRQSEVSGRQLYTETLSIAYQPDGINPEALQAQGDCRLEIRPEGAASVKRTIFGQKLQAKFAQGSSQIASFAAEGKVRVESRDGTELTIASSDKLAATFDPVSQDIGSLEQMGNFRYLREGKTAEGQSAKYDGKLQTFQIFGKPVLKDNQTTTYAEQVIFDEGNKRLTAVGQVRTVHKGRLGPFAAPEGAPTFVTAERLEIDEKSERAAYFGNALAVQEGNSIRAQRIEIYNREGEFHASGRAQSVYYRQEKRDRTKRPIKIAAKRMVYRQAQNVARYEEDASIQSSDMLVLADVVKVYFEGDDQQLKRIVAEGKVRMLQTAREGAGERAEYYPEEEKLILWGNLAQITDKNRGKSLGRRLTFYSNDDRILVDSNR